MIPAWHPVDPTGYCRLHRQYRSIAVRETARSSEDRDGGHFDAVPQDRVQAAAGYRVRLASKNSGGDVLDLHDVEEAEFAPFMVKKQIDVRSRPGFPASGGAEQE